MNRSLSKALALVAALAVMPATVSADLVPTGLPCDFTPLFSSPYPGFTPTPTMCFGAFLGNNVNQNADVLTVLNGSSTGFWTYLGTTNANETSGPFSSVPGASSGTVVFDLPGIYGSFWLALKAANAFSLYYFGNLALVALAGVEFVTDGVSLERRRDATRPVPRLPLRR